MTAQRAVEHIRKQPTWGVLCILWGVAVLAWVAAGLFAEGRWFDGGAVVPSVIVGTTLGLAFIGIGVVRLMGDRALRSRRERAHWWDIPLWVVVRGAGVTMLVWAALHISSPTMQRCVPTRGAATSRSAAQIDWMNTLMPAIGGLLFGLLLLRIPTRSSHWAVQLVAEADGASRRS